ncbi:MAG TPA: glutathione synthase [Polyangiaceae bacterium]|nr:glutathione synthase [Polyangiaceae bacterium]
MRFLFVMDPAHTMHPQKDTSFAFMRGAQARGHQCLHCVPRQVFNKGRQVFAMAQPITVSDSAPHVTLAEATSLPLSSVDAVFIRKDPPFDTDYLHLTHQLELARNDTLIINDPRALRDANEKLFAMEFAEYMPQTMVSADPEQLLAFLSEVGGKAVIKPLDGAGGSGVVGLATGDRNNRAIVDLLTNYGTRLAMVQQFLPEVFAGDKRVFVLDGNVIGAIRRVPRSDDIRANIHVGGQVQAVTLTDKEQRMAQDLGRRLREMGLWFVGLDVIAEHLIEVNVTSPTGIQELGRLNGTQPELQVIEWVERKVQQKSGSSAR